MVTTLDAYQNRIRRYSPPPAEKTSAAPTPSESEQRLLSLQSHCDLLADGFPQLDRLIERYVREVAAGRSQSQLADAERFLEWLSSQIEMDDEQRDLIVGLRSRHAVEYVALRQRLANARFQSLLANNARLIGNLSKRSRIQIQINPIHVWATFETRIMLDADTTIPATVLFYPVGGHVRSAVIDSDVRPLLRVLERGPVSVRSALAGMNDEERSDTLDILHELAASGIIALS